MSGESPNIHETSAHTDLRSPETKRTDPKPRRSPGAGSRTGLQLAPLLARMFPQSQARRLSKLLIYPMDRLIPQRNPTVARTSHRTSVKSVPQVEGASPPPPSWEVRHASGSERNIREWCLYYTRTFRSAPSRSALRRRRRDRQARAWGGDG